MGPATHVPTVQCRSLVVRLTESYKLLTKLTLTGRRLEPQLGWGRSIVPQYRPLVYAIGYVGIIAAR